MTYPDVGLPDVLLHAFAFMVDAGYEVVESDSYSVTWQRDGRRLLVVRDPRDGLVDATFLDERGAYVCGLQDALDVVGAPTEPLAREELWRGFTVAEVEQIAARLAGLVRDELGTFLTGDEATWAAARHAASQRNRRYNDDLRRQSDATRRRLAEDSE